MGCGSIEAFDLTGSRQVGAEASPGGVPSQSADPSATRRQEVLTEPSPVEDFAIELSVVGDDRVTAQEIGQLFLDGAELRFSGQHLWSKPMQA